MRWCVRMPDDWSVSASAFVSVSASGRNFKGKGGTKKKTEAKIRATQPKGGVHKRSAGATMQANGRYR